jgi:hypothetical protein
MSQPARAVIIARHTELAIPRLAIPRDVRRARRYQAESAVGAVREPCQLVIPERPMASDPVCHRASDPVGYHA